MKQQLLDCIQRNEEAPELERVDRTDFVIDRELVAGLQTTAEQRVQVGAREGGHRGIGLRGQSR